MTLTLNPLKRHRDRCRQVRAYMSDYLDGDLDPRAAAAVRRHVRWCPNCRRMLANLARTIRGLRDLPALADDPARDGLSGGRHGCGQPG